MKNKRNFPALSAAVSLAILVSACGGGSDSGEVQGNDVQLSSKSYVATSSQGDLVTYKIAGPNADIAWSVTSDVGAIRYTWNIGASCGAQDATYGYQSCTIDTAACVEGIDTCPVDNTPSGAFEMMELPGVALIAHVPNTIALNVNGVDHNELHSGFISGGCPADVSGDYAYIGTGAGTGSKELFGLFQVDATFNDVTHVDFGMLTAGTDPISTAVASYNTGTAAETLGGSLCENGVFTRTIGADTLRINATSGGSFILDQPSGSGGLVSFKTTNAATLADLASRNWWGLTFPDNGDPMPLSIQSGAVAAGAIAFTGDIEGGGAVNTTIKPATGGAALSPANKLDTPSGYDLAANPLFATYPAPKNIPGLMQIDDGVDGNVLAIAAKFGNQVMMYGVVFNFRTSAGAGCSAGDADCLPRNSGNFIAFSH